MKLLRIFSIIAALLLTPLGASAQAADPSGDWRGTLQVGAVQLRIALHLGETSSLDSPDQGVFGMPANYAADDRRVTVTIAAIDAMFAGELADDGSRLVGKWQQGGLSLPLTLERGVYAPAARPQTPAAPYPYRAEDVAYANPRAPSVRLAGTLTLPQGTGPFPAVLLITGSGPQDRDESLAGHRPFLVLADHLTRRGIAVLRVDDRGVGGSTGATANDTLHDYATDVAAGVAYLRSRRDIDARRVALLGHSEGGLIAPLVARGDPALAGIVLWAGPGVTGREVVAEQTRAIMRLAGTPAAQSEAALRTQRAMIDAALGAADPTAARQAMLAAVAAAGMPAPPEASLAIMASPGYRAFATHDPAPVLRGLRLPILALLAENDIQVVPAQNEPALRAALAGNASARVVTLPGLNHLFQTAPTGAVEEYARIEETVAPIALRTTADWLVQLLQLQPRASGQ